MIISASNIFFTGKLVNNEPLCFTAVDPGATITLNKTGNPPPAKIMVSFDKTSWTPYYFGTQFVLANVGDKVYFRAKFINPNTFYIDSSNNYRFASTAGKRIAASGNLNSLVSAFVNARTMATYQYKGLFAYNKALVTPPELPDTVLSPGCYEMLFGDCSALTSIPVLPATNINKYSYKNMFANCISLTEAYIPNMRSLDIQCCELMFQHAIWLKSITVGFNEFPQDSSNALMNWVLGLTGTGTFYCLQSVGDNNTIQRGNNYCPPNWNVVNISAEDLETNS